MSTDSPSTTTLGLETTQTLREVRRLVHLLLQSPMLMDGDGPGLLEALEEHLGAKPDEFPIITEEVPQHRMVDADIAMAEVAGRDPEGRLTGLGGDMRHHPSLGDLLQHARMRGGVTLGQVEYLQKATGPGPDDHRNVVAMGVWLFRYDGHPVVVRQQSATPHPMRPVSTLDVLTTEERVAKALIAEVRQLMDTRGVLRGQVVTFAHDPYGQGMAGITFLERPTLVSEDVILPPGVLERISEHVLGIGEHRRALLAHGQHLKRGVLLFGPPGTGKTHTMRYLLSKSVGTTAILLTGQSLMFIHDAAKVARAHQPAIVVLEDCDLVADDRSFGMGPKPLLFEVLDALDGLDSDADVAFLLTTNRVADLERALSQRPGRVDLAAEVPLPDEAGRLALLRLYARGLFSEAALTEAARRTEGTTASFAKELVRRAVLVAAVANAAPADDHLAEALDRLLSDGESLTRSLLGNASGPTPGSEGIPAPGVQFFRPPPGRGYASTAGPPPH